MLLMIGVMIGFEPISSRPYAGRTSNCASKSIFLQERPPRDNHNGITLSSLSVFLHNAKDSNPELWGWNSKWYHFTNDVYNNIIICNPPPRTPLLFHTTRMPPNLIFYFTPIRKRVFRSAVQAHFRELNNYVICSQERNRTSLQGATRHPWPSIGLEPTLYPTWLFWYPHSYPVYKSYVVKIAVSMDTG